MVDLVLKSIGAPGYKKSLCLFFQRDKGFKILCGTTLIVE